MRFKNSFHIMTDNFVNVFKMLLYRLVTGIIFFSLAYVILKLSLSALVESEEMRRIVELVKDFILSIISGESRSLHTFQEEFHVAIKDFVLLLGTKSGAIIGAVIGVCAIYLVARFMDGLSNYAIGDVLNDRMSVCARTTFSAAFFKNIGRASLYEVIYVPLSFVYDAVSILLCWFFFFYAPSFLPSWRFITIMFALSVTLLALICLQAIKLALISDWMPRMIADGKGAGSSLGYSLKRGKGFAKKFAGYLVASYIIFVTNCVFAVFTFGSALLISVPASFLFLLGMQFVNYYQDHGRKYFISSRDIVGGDDTPGGISIG